MENTKTITLTKQQATVHHLGLVTFHKALKEAVGITTDGDLGPYFTQKLTEVETEAKRMATVVQSFNDETIKPQ